ncbi:hypothetical protein F3Y22_tig00111402pilonHSYRG00056 [Hibiscus syriacus]|uniref:Reverse transcriptase zinc-binding domain-containing protein n=1 Tax=Hibiscus syriacus TaxID=106335 RepID=A0A6A2XSS1_HIBSY|nr:hypothetical protein F3Y22_tig00111402pilonHSYRG00056 [Hibiscus syriacus]
MGTLVGYFAAFALVAKRGALWVQVPKQKYSMTSLCPLSIRKPACSPLWSAISHAWDSARDNFLRLIGNGNSLRLWDDTWVPSLGPLRQWALFRSTVTNNIHVKDLVQSGSWDTSSLYSLLVPKAIPHVLGIFPPGTSPEDDVIVWRPSPTGRFSVASAYESLVSSAWEDCNPIWHLLYKLPIPERIRIFLWLVIKQRIMTNEERVRRGFVVDPSRLSCSCLVETAVDPSCSTGF